MQLGEEGWARTLSRSRARSSLVSAESCVGAASGLAVLTCELGVTGLSSPTVGDGTARAQHLTAGPCCLQLFNLMASFGENHVKLYSVACLQSKCVCTSFLLVSPEERKRARVWGF